MKRKRFTEEQIIGVLNEAEQTGNIREVCRLNNISEQTFYRWRTKFGGMDVSEARRLKDLERENGELKKMVAELSLDNRMLKDLNSKKW
jgi:putative transposase